MSHIKITTRHELPETMVQHEIGRFAGYRRRSGHDTRQVQRAARRAALMDLLKNAEEQGADALVDVHFEVVYVEDQVPVVEIYAFGTGVRLKSDSQEKSTRSRITTHAPIQRRVDPTHLPIINDDDLRNTLLH